MRKAATVAITSGPLLKNIVLFALPLMGSNVLQLLFNAADLAVVGRFVGSESLAAVGSTVPLIYLVVNLLFGISIGVNVIVALYIGQSESTGRRAHEISITIHTAMTMAIFGGIAFGILGIAVTGAMLSALGTPENVMQYAKLYLRIYFCGTPFVMIADYGAAALRAKGDTKRPFYYLCAGSITNIALNLFFVLIFHWGTAGVAIATVIAQFLNAFFMLRHFCREEGALRFYWKKIGIDKQCAKRLLRIGIPAGIQASMFSLSNTVIQSAINGCGSVVMAASAAANSLEGFLYISINSFQHTCQSFVAQNLGAERHDRVRKAVRLCCACSAGVATAGGILIILFAHPLVSIYNQDPAVIREGSLRLAVVLAIYGIFAVQDTLTGAIRGYGIALPPMIFNIVGTCVFRILYIFFLDFTVMGSIWIYFSYPFSWSLVFIAMVLYWFRLQKKFKANGMHFSY